MAQCDRSSPACERFIDFSGVLLERHSGAVFPTCCLNLPLALRYNNIQIANESFPHFPPNWIRPAAQSPMRSLANTARRASAPSKRAF